MSALAHYLEEEGVPSVAISLIRPQTERTGPPRALWVPFELGRPFGPPGDPGFQKRVILAALGLLERASGPIIIEDFAEDDPRSGADPQWAPPLPAASLPDRAPAKLAERVEAEIAALSAAYDRARAPRGRSTVGLSGLSIEEAGRCVAAWLRGEAPASPNPAMSAGLLLRFAVDDLKAYYLEAADPPGRAPSSRQLTDWLWTETAFAAALRHLREQLMQSGEDRLKVVGNFMVPAARVGGG